MENRNQGEQKIQIGSWALAIALQAAAGPWQGNHHAAEAIEGDQPNKLNRQGKGGAQGGSS